MVDKEKRARLWDIYLGATIESKDKLTRAESMRIRHIEKQLANINRIRRLTNETLVPPVAVAQYNRSRSDSRQMPARTEPPDRTGLALRRRSSLDSEALERWKALANEEKPHEQLPWSMRKLLIRRYFRRLPKKPSAMNASRPDPTTTSDNLLHFAQDITVLTQHHSDEELNEFSSPDDDRKNPYLTYFYHPPASTRPSILSAELFSSTQLMGEK